MKLYRIAKSNRIVPDYKLEIIDEIFGVGMVENLVKNHTITEIEKLNVIDCLKYGSKVVAIKCYMQIHNCTSVTFTFYRLIQFYQNKKDMRKNLHILFVLFFHIPLGLIPNST